MVKKMKAEGTAPQQQEPDAYPPPATPGPSSACQQVSNGEAPPQELSIPNQSMNASPTPDDEDPEVRPGPSSAITRDNDPEQLDVRESFLNATRSAINQRLESIRKLQNGECLANQCTKRPAVSCPTCKRMLYCTDKHRRTAKFLHEAHCYAYREIDNKTLGRHVIAARDLKRASKLIEDQPVLILPMNPSIERRLFPDNYCVKCFLTLATPLKVECPAGCHLPVCSTPCQFEFLRFLKPLDFTERNQIPAHNQFECKYLSEAFNRGVEREFQVVPDQSVIGILRCIPVLNQDTSKAFTDLMDSIQYEPYTPNFESKLTLCRNVLKISNNIVTDKELYKMDQVLLRFGRNIGPGIVTLTKLPFVFSLYARCIFPKLAHVIHSCTPNSILTVTFCLSAEIYAVKEIKKGDPLSIYYDERALFMPTRYRRMFLDTEFRFQCKCKRCVSQSELETYYSSFPCSRCPQGQGYLVPENPLDPYSDWMCNKCAKTTVFYLRIIDTTINLEEELEIPLKKEDPLGLLALMFELVDENLLHWNHHVIFHTSIKLFDLLWAAFNKKDLNVIEAYSKERGLQFLKPAEAVLRLTQVFMPDGYTHVYNLAIRLSALIKVRHLTEQIEGKETTLEKVNCAINDIYYRGYDITYSSLMERRITANIPLISAEERNLHVLEMRVLTDLVRAAEKMYGPNFEKKVKDLMRLYHQYGSAMEDKDLVDLIAGKGFQNVGVFPWNIDV